MPVFGALLLVTWYVVSLRGRSHSRFRKRWGRRRPLSSVFFRLNRVGNVSHILCKPSPATVLSIDGIGAFDLISRGAMLDGLRSVAGGDSVLPFVVQFMAIRLLICGTTMTARRMRSGREKEESRAILLCPCCMLSGSTKLCDQCNLASVLTRDSWHSTMMCTPLHSQSG